MRVLGWLRGKNAVPRLTVDGDRGRALVLVCLAAAAFGVCGCGRGDAPRSAGVPGDGRARESDPPAQVRLERPSDESAKVAETDRPVVGESGAAAQGTPVASGASADVEGSETAVSGRGEEPHTVAGTAAPAGEATLAEAVGKTQPSTAVTGLRAVLAKPERMTELLNLAGDGQSHRQRWKEDVQGFLADLERLGVYRDSLLEMEMEGGEDDTMFVVKSGILDRGQEVLRGSVHNTQITMNTAYARLEFPLRNCRRLSFAPGGGGRDTLVTVTGSRCAGTMVGGVDFRTGSERVNIDRRWSAVHLLLRPETNEFAPAPRSGPQVLLMTNGDVLTGGVSESPTLVTQAREKVALVLGEVETLCLQGGKQPAAIVTKRNGDVVQGRLVGGSMAVRFDGDTARDGGTPSPKRVSLDQIARVYANQGSLQVMALLQHGSAAGQHPAETYPTAKGAAGDHELVLNLPGLVGVPLRMRLIPAGSFRMGSEAGVGNDDERPQHEVAITCPFYMGVFEVTQAQWEAVMGTHPSVFYGRPEHPVERISWDDCHAFVANLNRMGLGTFRLPTEAEWEYACRAGTATRCHWGDGVAGTLVDQHAWHSGISHSGTQPVGQKKPNAWGLHDMNGNVWEWCEDWYGVYSADSKTDPKSQSGSGFRVFRGGSWEFPSESCSSPGRYRFQPSIRYGDLGFRLVRTVE